MSNQTFSQHGKFVELLEAQDVIADATATQSDNDCTGGFRWAFVALVVTTNNATGDSTFTVKSSPASGGSYSLITDDGANLNASGVASTATITVPAGETGIFFGEIDLRHTDEFFEAAFVNGGGSNVIIGGAYAVLSGASRRSLVGNTLQFEIHSSAKSTY